MTPTEFVDLIVERHSGMRKRDVKKIVYLMWGAVRSALERGESVQITGIGTIAPRYVKRDFKWKHPSGRVMHLTDKIRVEFRPANKFEKQLTEKFVKCPATN